MSPSGSRKMFPAWSRTHTHATPQWRARMVSDPVDNHPANMFPSAQFQSAIASPQSPALPILQSIFKCQSGGLGGGRNLHDRCANFGRGLDSALQTEKTPLALDIECTKYMVQATKICTARARGPISSLTHTGARRFSAPYSKSIQGRGQSTSHRTRLPSLIPPFSASLPWRDVSEVVPQPCNAHWEKHSGT